LTHRRVDESSADHAASKYAPTRKRPPINQGRRPPASAAPYCLEASGDPAAMMGPKSPMSMPASATRFAYRDKPFPPFPKGKEGRKSFWPLCSSRDNGRGHRNRASDEDATDRRRRQGPRPVEGRPRPEERLRREGQARGGRPSPKGPARQVRPRHRHDPDPLRGGKDADHGRPRPGPEPPRH